MVKPSPNSSQLFLKRLNRCVSNWQLFKSDFSNLSLMVELFSRYDDNSSQNVWLIIIAFEHTQQQNIHDSMLMVSDIYLKNATT